MKPTLELGLLDAHQPLATLGPDDIDTAASRQLALEAAQQAITLLKNEKPDAASDPALAAGVPAAAAPLLPLGKATTVALIGPAVNFTAEMLSNCETMLQLSSATRSVAKTGSRQNVGTLNANAVCFSVRSRMEHGSLVAVALGAADRPPRLAGRQLCTRMRAAFSRRRRRRLVRCYG